MMTRTILILTAALLATPAIADGLDYNYLEGGYQRIELDDDFFDVDGDGFGIGGSFEVGDNAFVFGSYGTADFDFGIDFNELTAGVGYHVPVGTNTDFVASIAYVRAEAEASGIDIDDNGIGASIGLRSMVTDTVEVFGNINYVDLDDSGDDTSFSGGAWFNVTETFALGVSAGFGDDTTTYGASARLYFGR